MPTYEYRCTNGHEFEQFQRISEAPIATCPSCGAAVERLFSVGGGLLFKGPGFYTTDYRKESYKKAAAAESGGNTGEGGASKSETKSSSSETKDSGAAKKSE